MASSHRFGLIAIEMGFITVEHLCDALKAQVMEEAKSGHRRLIGTILHEMGYMTAEQVNEVLRELFG